MRNIILSSVISILIASSLGQSYPDCQGTPNLNALINEQPQLLQSTTNGKKYKIQSSTDSTSFIYIAALSGSAYDMGVAYGQLFKTELTDLQTQFDAFLTAGASELLKSTATYIQDQNMSAYDAFMFGVRIELLGTNHYTPQRFLDELNGLADGSGLPLQFFQALNLLPELIEAQCTIAGIWGDASSSGNLVQLRALDWDATSPFPNFPIAVIYNSNEPGSNIFANIGFVGLIGTIAGYSTKVGVSEKVWGPTETNITTLFGQPWSYVLRDVLQFGSGLNDSISALYNANRTYQIYIGIGSKEDNQLRGLQFSYGEIYQYNDMNWSLPYTPNHPQMAGIFYWDKTQGQGDACLAEIFSNNYGILDAEMVYQEVTALGQTGNTLVGVYDFGTDEVYVSYSNPESNTPAYTRPLIYLNMTQLFGFAQEIEVFNEIEF